MIQFLLEMWRWVTCTTAVTTVSSSVYSLPAHLPGQELLTTSMSACPATQICAMTGGTAAVNTCLSEGRNLVRFVYGFSAMRMNTTLSSVQSGSRSRAPAPQLKRAFLVTNYDEWSQKSGLVAIRYNRLMSGLPLHVCKQRRTCTSM